MKSNAFRRAVVVVVVYIAVAVLLTLAQFSRNTGFTFNIGSIAVSGKYAADIAEEGGKTVRAVTGPVSVFFGGMEFRLSSAEGLLAIRGTSPHPVGPLAIQPIADGLIVRLEGGSELRFITQFSSGSETLRVTAVLAKGETEIRVPYKPLRSSRIAETASGKSAVVADGATYAFNAGSVDPDKRQAILRAASPAFTYGKQIERKGVAATDLVLPQAADVGAYENAKAAWLDRAFAAWERAMGGSPDEETVAVYMTESLRRGNYRSAIATTPKSFIDGNARGYATAPFFGRLDQGLRTLVAVERETLGRISRLANERDRRLFEERDLISYLELRASKTLSDDIAAFAATLDPAATTTVLATGYLECAADWKRLYPTKPNPFDKLMDQARFVLSRDLKKFEDGFVVVAVEGRADIALSLRAGAALVRAGAGEKDRPWIELGRTLVLSAVSLADPSGHLPASFSVPSEAGTLSQAAQGATDRIPHTRVYRSLWPEREAPRAVSLINDDGTTVWAWTAAPSRAVRDAEALDISVEFPVGETHYMLIRGIRPFEKIQLYGIDFRTDPRFERYDSSGWAYSASEQTLLVKMKHRSNVEHIRIFYP